MKTVVIAGVALGCLAMSGCVSDETVVRKYQSKYSEMHSMALCDTLVTSYSDFEKIAASRVLRERGEDCKDFSKNRETLTIKQR